MDFMPEHHVDLEQAKAQMKRDMEEAQKKFRGRCRVVLMTAYQDADAMSSAIGSTISVDEAFDTWKGYVQTLLDKG